MPVKARGEKCILYCYHKKEDPYLRFFLFLFLLFIRYQKNARGADIFIYNFEYLYIISFFLDFFSFIQSNLIKYYIAIITIKILLTELWKFSFFLSTICKETYFFRNFFVKKINKIKILRGNFI